MFEHRNTLVAAQTEHNLYFSLECVSCEYYVFISALEHVDILTFSDYWSNGHDWPQDLKIK